MGKIRKEKIRLMTYSREYVRGSKDKYVREDIFYNIVRGTIPKKITYMGALWVENAGG